VTRIIAGTARGRRLAVPRGTGTRPTSDKVRGAVFNVLGQFFEGGAVLDLYAGTGALALEALSRGCARAVCVEADRAAAEVLRRNAEACGLAARVEVRRERALDALARLPRAAFDLAFLDPPYGEGPEAALAALASVLAPGGRAVAEHDARRPPADRYEGLALAERRAWGDTAISIYVREGVR
jgi:16S rRNA (guanine966-N2)-methyltransferase